MNRRGSGDSPGMAAKLRAVWRRLAHRFGEPALCGHETSPVENLVLTILSQNTNDANRDRAFASLRRRFPTVSRLASAAPEELEQAIRVGGLARTKAAAILAALSRLKAERGGYTLEFLRSMPLEEAPLHLNLIRLGRELCRPRNPLCPSCPLLPLCPEGARTTRAGGLA
jgi:endonuclease III